MTKMLNPKNFNIFSVADEEIAAFVGLSNAEDQLRRYIENKYRAHFPSPDDLAAKQIAEDALAHALRRLERMRAQEELTDLYTVSDEPDPDAKRNWIESGIGLVALLTLLIAMLTVPAIATMLIIEANKIALVADWPIFGLIFGVSALAGILAAIEFRDKFRSDNARLTFDRKLLKATVAVFLLWAVIASLVAFPPEIPGTGASVANVSQGDWGKLAGSTTTDSIVAQEPPLKLAPPMWLLFFVTALLDLVAAPTLHRFALRRLTSRPIKRLLDDGENEHLHGVLGVKAKAEADEAAAVLKTLADADQSWRAAVEMHVGMAFATLRRLTSRVEAARNAAAEDALRDALKTPPHDESDPEEPDSEDS